MQRKVRRTSQNVRNPIKMNTSVRREGLHILDKIETGQIIPAACIPFKPLESGMVQMSISEALDSIVGKLISKVRCRVRMIYVPSLATYEFLNPADDTAGVEEMFLRKMVNGDVLFPLEAENDISRRCGINPKSISGTKMVSSQIAAAYTVAINYMRRRAYRDADQLTAVEYGLTPAVLSHTALDRFNGVLDPEDRLNGGVNLTGTIPVTGIGLRTLTIQPSDTSSNGSRQSDGSITDGTTPGWVIKDSADATGEAQLVIDEDPDNPGHPIIQADFGLGSDSRLSLEELNDSRRMHKMTRALGYIADKYPEREDEFITRLVRGLRVETGSLPYEVFDHEYFLNNGVRAPSDWANIEEQVTQTYGDASATRLIGGNQTGGMLFAFVEIKPDEVMNDVPHPILTDTDWSAPNAAEEQFAQDPVPVNLRELNCEVAAIDEEQRAMYVGHNHIKRFYNYQGYRRGTNLASVDHRASLFQLDVPVSVTPENILFDNELDNNPFLVEDGSPVSHSCRISATIMSPMTYGPTPQERLDVLDQVFENVDSGEVD